MLAVPTGMRLGQIGISPSLGKAADRFGNKPMMLFCLLITAQGPLFYFFATPAELVVVYRGLGSVDRLCRAEHRPAELDAQNRPPRGKCRLLGGLLHLHRAVLWGKYLTVRLAFRSVWKFFLSWNGYPGTSTKPCSSQVGSPVAWESCFYFGSSSRILPTLSNLLLCLIFLKLPKRQVIAIPQNHLRFACIDYFHCVTSSF